MQKMDEMKGKQELQIKESTVCMHGWSQGCQLHRQLGSSLLQEYCVVMLKDTSLRVCALHMCLVSQHCRGFPCAGVCVSVHAYVQLSSAGCPEGAIAGKRVAVFKRGEEGWCVEDKISPLGDVVTHRCH